MRRAGYLLPAALAACLALGAIALFLSGPLTTRAVQNPRISLDMDPAGNSYDGCHQHHDRRDGGRLPGKPSSEPEHAHSHRADCRREHRGPRGLASAPEL